MSKRNTRQTNNEQTSDLNEDTLHNPSEVLNLLKEVHKSQNFLSTQFDDFNKRTQLLEQENKELKSEVTYLRSRLYTVEAEINDLQHEMHKTHLYITGVPTSENENLQKLIMNIATITNTQINNNNIISCKRNINNKSNKQPQIVVELDSITTKEDIIKNLKANGPILLNQLKLAPNDVNTKIFINEFLSSRNKKILFEAQKLKSKFNIKFVWAKHGSVFLRQSETANSIKIRNLEQLTEIEKELTKH